MSISHRLFSLSPLLLLSLLLMGSGRPPSTKETAPILHLPKIVSVKDFAKSYGFTDVKVTKDQVRLKGKVHELVLFKHSRRAELNGTLVWLSDAMVVKDRIWVLSQTDVQLTLLPMLRPADVLKDLGFKVVVLDPGHGGKDGGAVSPAGIMEKQVVLDITRQVRAHLMAQGYLVYVTRHDDRFLELTERPRRAEKWKADVFVSIHANSGNPTAQGTESFALSLPGYYSTNQSAGSPVPTQAYPGNLYNQANMSLAFAIHHALVQKNGLTDRGVRRARFSVLKNAPCPAALVEVGFLSNVQEGAKLANPEHRKALSLSIATGIDNYLRTVKKAAINAENPE